MIINEASGKVTFTKEDLDGNMEAVTVSDTPGTRVGRWEIEYRNGPGNTGELTKLIQYFSVVGAPVFTTIPTIQGNFSAGNTLSLDTPPVATDTVSFSYQWKRDGADISGATGVTFNLSNVDNGTEISLQIVANGFAGQSTSRTVVGGVVNFTPTITDPGTISGARNGLISGTSPTVTGLPSPTITYQWQAFTSGVWADIAEATGSTYNDTSFTSAMPLRRRVTASNLLGSVADVSNTLDPFVDVGSLRLVRLNTRYFPDTAAVGDTLATIQFAPIGSTITVQTEDNIANAFTVTGNEIKAGTGYASIPCRIIVLHIRVTFSGTTKLTVMDVDKYSAGPVSFPTCTTEVELDNAIAAANAAPGTKFVIELNKAGGAEWNRGRTITLRPTGTGQVIIRAAGGLNATAQRFNNMRMDVFGGEGVYCQNIQRQSRLTGQELQDGATKACMVYTGTNASVGPYRWFRCNVKGGVASYAGINPDQSYDPTIDGMARIGDLFYFRANYASGTAAPIVSISPYDPRARTTLPAITRAANPTGGLFTFQPQYVGDNLPGGVLPNMTGWPATGGVPLVFYNQNGGSGASARFKAEFLEASDPRAYAGAGNYATEIQIDSWGTGYLNPAGTEFFTYSCWWNTRPDGLGGTIANTERNVRSLATGEYSDYNPHVEWSECRFEDLGNVIYLPVKDNSARRFLTRCLIDRYSLDVMAWGTSAAVTVQQDWHPSAPKLRFWGNIFGRALGNAADASNPHFDIFQLFAQGGNDLRYYVDWVRNIFDAGLNVRGEAQCLFFTDSNPVPAADLGDVFDGFYFGHLQRGGIKSYNSTFTSATRMHRFLSAGGAFELANGGAGSAPGIRRNELGSYAYLSDVIASGAVNGQPKSLQLLSENVRNYSGSDFPNINTYSFINTYEKAIESFTPLEGSLSEGYTPVDDMDQMIDWVGGGFDPDTVPVAFPFVPKFDVEEGAIVEWAPRQIHYGVDPVVINPGTPDVFYQTGGAPDYNGELDSPSGWSNANTTIPRGTWFKPRKTAPVGIMQQGVAEILLNGKSSIANTYTVDKNTPLIVSEELTGSFLASTNGATVTPSATWGDFRRVVIFGKLRVPFPYIPSGNLTLFKGTGTNATDIFLTSYGNIRVNSGGSTNMAVSFDRLQTLKAGADYNFIIALDYNIDAYSTASPTTATGLNPGAAQVFADFIPMVKNAGAIYGDPADNNVPLIFGTSPRIFADELSAERPNGWGLYHIGVWADKNTTPLPNFLDWNVARAFTSQFLDGLTPGHPGNYPGRGVIDVLGPGLRLLVRGDVAQANGAGLLNLAPIDTAAGAGSMAPFILGSGSPNFTDIIIPSAANYPVLNNGFSNSRALTKGTTSLNLTDWIAHDAVELIPGERLVVGISSDGTSQVLSTHPDALGSWTLLGRAASGDSTLHIFSCVNNTPDVITARLRVSGTVAENMASITYKATPRYPGATIAVAHGVGTVAGDPPEVILGSSQKAVSLVFRSRAGNAASDTTNTPVGYSVPENTSTGTPNTTGTRIGAASRQFEGISENPGQWQGATGSDAGGNGTVILWEILP